MSMTIEELLKQAAERLLKARRVVVLTGAGVSAESGIPTFRDAQTGLWEQYDPAELASPDGFSANPKLVWDWYEYRRQIVRSSAPNPAHFALAELETRYQQFVLVTQNVDQFHTQAGSQHVLELHGRILENRCFAEDRLLADVELDHSTVPPRCPCGAFARPGVVWFGEALPADTLSQAFAAARRCDLCLVVGTSGVVQPAASIPLQALHAGAFLIEVNNQESVLTETMHLFLRGKAGELLPRLVKLLDNAVD
ncbi:MAG: NAD-dependent deacylase [Acidobacteriota bacterium]